MFADPIPSFTYNSVAQTLPRVSSAGQKATYRTSDGVFVVTISHQTTNSLLRSMARIDRNVDVNGDNVLERHSFYMVYERPLSGFTETDMLNLSTCLINAMTASTNAGLKKLNGLES